MKMMFHIRYIGRKEVKASKNINFLFLTLLRDKSILFQIRMFLLSQQDTLTLDTVYHITKHPEISLAD